MRKKGRGRGVDREPTILVVGHNAIAYTSPSGTMFNKKTFGAEKLTRFLESRFQFALRPDSFLRAQQRILTKEEKN
jgi:hypothetical protein